MALKMLDVAKMAEVSVATVSKYINGKYISDEYRLRVEKALRESDYRLNTAARNLKTRRSKLVGVLVQSITSSFTASVMFNIQRFLLEHGYTTIILDCRSSRELEERNLDVLLQLQVDGIILKPGKDEAELLRHIIKNNVPVVLVDNLIPGIDCDAVVTDNFDSAYRITRKVIECGHERIAVCSGQENSYTANERTRGYEQAMREAGYPIFVERAGYSVQEGYNVAQKVLESDYKPTAVITTNYYMTVGLVRAIYEKHLSVPDDISVYAFDEQDFDYALSTRIASVVQPIRKISRSAVELLLERTENHKKPFEVRIEKTETHETESVKKIR